MRSRRLLWISASGILFSMCLAQDEAAHARRLASEALGIDAHIDTLQRVVNENTLLGQRLPDGHVDLVRLREGGIRAPFFALWVPTYYKGAEAVRRTLQLRDAMQRVIDANPRDIELAASAAAIERIHGAGRIAAVLTLEGGHQIDNDLAVLRTYRLLGITGMTLTHFRNNDWADASTDKPAHNGLTEFGKEVVREMNRIGMLIDVSHVSDKTFSDVLQTTNRPVIASHSACRALIDIPRNMSDDMLRALARNGGVIGINLGSGFLNRKAAEGLEAGIGSMMTREPDLTGRALDEYARNHFVRGMRVPSRGPAATMDEVVAHIEHVIRVAGVDHVGIGSDFDGVSSVPAGLEDVSKIPNLTAALLRRGHSEAEVRKILGTNVLRVFRAATGG